MSLSELIAHVGNENIQWQRLDESITGARQLKGRVAVTFETTGLTMAEVASGKYSKRCLIVWLPVERLPKPQ